MSKYIYVGKRLYYLKDTGRVIVDTGEWEGHTYPHNTDLEFEQYAELQKYTKESIDFIELEYRQYATEFAECTGYYVDVAKKEIVFEYGEKPNPPEIPQTPTLHERMETQEKANKAQDDLILDNAYRVALLELNAQGIAL